MEGGSLYVSPAAAVADTWAKTRVVCPEQTGREEDGVTGETLKQTHFAKPTTTRTHDVKLALRSRLKIR